MEKVLKTIKLNINYKKTNFWFFLAIASFATFLLLKVMYSPKNIDINYIKELYKNNSKVSLVLEENTTFSKNYLTQNTDKNYRFIVWLKDADEVFTELEQLKIPYANIQIEYFQYLIMVRYYPFFGFLTIFFLLIGLKNYLSDVKMEKGNFLVRQFNVKFADVAGIESTRNELEELVKNFTNPSVIKTMGGQILKGAILYGPPGTGKTLMAKAVASEAGANFISASGSEFVELYVGMGAKRVREMFENARKNTPCVIFIDELDAFAKKRGGHNTHSELEQTINQMLTEMDGMKNNDGILVLAATNRLEDLDDAIIRSGRFDMKIKVDLPAVKGRKDILELYINKNKKMKDIDTDLLAKITRGFSGADLKNLVDQAIYVAIQRINKGDEQKLIVMKDFMDAKDKIQMGVVRDLSLTDEEKKHTAYHEVGHALCAKFCNTEVSKISILPRSLSLGETQINEDEKYSYSDVYIKHKIIMLLGGRVAEKLMFNHQSSGASNDLERATMLARHYVCSYGMTDIFGPINFKYGSQEYSFLSETIKAQIDRCVIDILKECENETFKLLTDNKKALIAISEHLIEHETMDSIVFDKLFTEYVGVCA